MTRRPGLAAAAAAAGALALVGCGSSAPALPTVLHAAPEPAVSPPLTTTPAGQVVDLHVDEPEGVVVGADGTAAVAARRPDALVLLPAATPDRLRTVRVPGAARHLELTPDRSAVLVPGEDTDVLSTVALPGGSITAQVKVGRQPHDAVQLGGTVVVADELGGAVTAVDTATGGTVTQKLPVQPGGVAGSAGRAGVVDVRGRLLDVYDPAPLHLVAQVPVGAGPTHAVDVGGGLLVVADTSGGQLLVVRLSGTPAVVATVALPGRPYGLAYDTRRHVLYAATGSDNVLHAYAVSGSRLTATRTWPTVRQPNSAAVDETTGRVLVAGATPDGTLEAIDP